MKKKINNTNLVITQGEVTKEQTDILINWTIPRLNGGDALFFKIHEDGGSTIYKDCQRCLVGFAEQQTGDTPTDGIVPVGKAIVTTAGILPIKFIIHAVVPDFRTPRELTEHQSLLQAAIQNSLNLITQYRFAKESIRKITFTPVPAIIYGSENNKEAATTLIRLLLDYAKDCELRTIKITCQTPEDYKLYSEELYQQTSTGFERFINRLFKLPI